MTSDKKALWAAIAGHPGEDTPKLALADWYAEVGDHVVALALRWLVARKVWPTGSTGRFVLCRQTTRPGRHHLPGALFDAMPADRSGIPLHVLSFQRWCSTEAAVRSVGRAIEKLRAACQVPT